MEIPKPFLAKFARAPQPHTVVVRKPDQNAKENGRTTSTVTPRPTSHTFVRNETTDDQ